MTYREKLIELLDEAQDLPCAESLEGFADNLISHGVVVRDKGEWIAYPDCGVTRCSVCDWSIEEAWYSNFCPNCGADMRGEHGN